MVVKLETDTDDSHHVKVIMNGGDSSRSANAQAANRQDKASSRSRRYYVDELGFYRYLDAEQRHYVCSNVNMIDTSRGNTIDITRTRISSGEAGLEICIKTVRNDLGISHFDKTEDYLNWKRGWDDFMRVKLTTQQPVTLNRELKNRVRSGIPHDYRCKVWTALIRMRTRSIRSKFGDDIYNVIIHDFVSKVDIPDYSKDDVNNNSGTSNNITHKKRGNSSNVQRVSNVNKANGSSYISGMSSFDKNRVSFSTSTDVSITPSNSNQRLIAQEPLIDKCFKQIELDLLRTLPNNRHFENPNSIGIQRVRRVLRAYACFNQAVGYCQGMNRLAAMALLVLPEEEAFWCLVAIIQCIMPKDYYLKPWLAQVDCCVLSDLLEKKMPKLHKHLTNNDIQLTLFSWFFTIFVDGFRPELMLRIWDCFLLEGDKVLFRFALAILYITQDDLLKMNDFSTMSSHLSRLISTRKLDVEELFDTFNTMNPLSTGTLQARREFHMNRMRTMLEDD